MGRRRENPKEDQAREQSTDAGKGDAGLEPPERALLQSRKGSLALAPDQAEYRTSFLGIGFYRDLDGQQLWTSTAQMFDERGRGLILRGARAQTETKGRHPYLTAKDAEDLVAQSINAYKAHHRHVPARVVVLKTSRFRPEEATGIDAALEQFGIEMSDLVWVQESSPIAIFRDGNYPVLRGTFIDLAGKGLLYTRGSVPYYGTYPGLRV